MEDLNKYLKKPTGGSSKKNNKKKSKKKASAAGDKRRKGSNTSGKTNPNITNQGNQTTPTKHASKKARKGSTDKIPPEELQLQLDIAKMKQKILDEAVEMAKKQEELEEMKRQRLAMQNKQSNDSEKENVDDSDYNAIRISCPTPKTSAKKINTKNNVTAPFFYTLPDGRVGQLNQLGTGIIFEEDLLDNLVDVPAGRDDEKSAGIRAKRNRKTNLASFGASQAWIPKGCSLIPTAYLTELQEAKRVHTNLVDTFNSSKCTFGPGPLTTMAAHNLHNYGGSDEATEMAIAGAYAALFEHIGLKIDPKKLGKACPSQRTIARYEHNIATDCLIKVMQEIKDDGAKKVGIISDHGHRGKQGHFVVVIIWSGKDENGNDTLKFFCPSIDNAGHSGANAAEAMQKVLDRFLADEEIEAHVLTGDAGGGAAVQNLTKELKKLGIIVKETNCSLHGVQKSLENGSKKTLGDQGMGCRTPFQMLYLFALLMGKIREEGGISHLDTLWAVIVEELQTNESWQKVASEKMKQAWLEFLDKIDSFDENDPDQMDSLIKFLNESPRNIQDPVWTRWQSVSVSVYCGQMSGQMICLLCWHAYRLSHRCRIAIISTKRCVNYIRFNHTHFISLIASFCSTFHFFQIIKTCDIFLDNYVQIYFLAVSCKIKHKSDSYIWKIACALLSLMNERAEPNLEGSESIGNFIDSFTDESAATKRGCDSLTALQPGDSPTFYTMLLFHRAFCEYAFNDNFSFLLRNNSCFGEGTFGQLSQFMAERTYVMYKQMNELKDGGWENVEGDAFKKYKDALKGIPEKSEHSADRSFFNAMPNTFIANYEKSLNEHVLERWRSNELLWYGLGGNEHIAQAIAQWLVDYDDGIPVDDDGEMVNAEVPPYAFSDMNVTLGEQHTVTQGEVVINLKRCMEFLTANADRKVIKEEPFIKEHWVLIEKLAAAENAVRLFDKNDDGKYYFCHIHIYHTHT